MSLLSNVTPTHAPTATQPSQIGNDVICETVLHWVVEPPTAPLGWDRAAWEEARLAMAVHGISPLLYQQLHTTSAWSYLSPEVRHWLQEQYHFNQQRAHLIMGELEAILTASNEADITVVPLKGSAALYRLYQDDPALRPMADIDLMVRPADEPRFTEILHRLGYQDEEQTPRHRTFAHPTANTVASTRGEHPNNPRGIQLHTAINEQFWGSRYDVTDMLWEGTFSRFGSAKGWLSHPIGFMQHLLVHASADVIAGKARMVRLYDIALLAKQFDEKAWQSLVQNALQKGEARWFYTALWLTERYWQGTVPTAVLEQLAQTTPQGWRTILERSNLYYLSFCNPLRVSLQERLTWHRPGRERIAALWHCLFPAPTILREYHPDLSRKRQLPLAYARHLSSMVDGYRRTLFHVPRRSWLRREQGGK
jgi:hypothetical protein